MYLSNIVDINQAQQTLLVNLNNTSQDITTTLTSLNLDVNIINNNYTSLLQSLTLTNWNDNSLIRTIQLEGMLPLIITNDVFITNVIISSTNGITSYTVTLTVNASSPYNITYNWYSNNTSAQNGNSNTYTFTINF